MKKILTLGIFMSLFLQLIPVSAELDGTVTRSSSSTPTAYNTAEAFLEAEGNTCETATDGCNTIMITEQGTFGASTEMACQADPIYSCTKQKEEEMRMCTMEYAPVCGIDGVTYSNSCMAGDVEIVSENECSEEKSKLSDNDLSFYTTIQTKVDEVFQTRVTNAIGNYEKRVNMLMWSQEKKGEFHDKMIQKIETMISQHLLKYPQDIALPERANDKYLKLSLIKFELMMLDM